MVALEYIHKGITDSEITTPVYYIEAPTTATGKYIVLNFIDSYPEEIKGRSDEWHFTRVQVSCYGDSLLDVTEISEEVRLLFDNTYPTGAVKQVDYNGTTSGVQIDNEPRQYFMAIELNLIHELTGVSELNMSRLFSLTAVKTGDTINGKDVWVEGVYIQEADFTTTGDAMLGYTSSYQSNISKTGKTLINSLVKMNAVVNGFDREYIDTDISRVSSKILLEFNTFSFLPSNRSGFIFQWYTID